MFSLMTLQNSMDERKLKNYQHFISVYSLMSVCYVCVCVCVCRAGPVCVKWNGGGCLFSVTVRRVEGGRGRGETDKHGLQRLCSHCDLNQMETELHFLTECSKYTERRERERRERESEREERERERGER